MLFEKGIFSDADFRLQAREMFAITKPTAEGKAA